MMKWFMFIVFLGFIAWLSGFCMGLGIGVIWGQ